MGPPEATRLDSYCSLFPCPVSFHVKRAKVLGLMFVTDKCKLEFLARYAFQTVRTCKYFVGWDDTSPPLPSPLLYSQYCTILYCQCQGFGHWCTCPTFVSNLYSQWLSDALKTTNKTLSLSRSLDKTFHSTICLMFFWKIRETLG